MMMPVLVLVKLRMLLLLHVVHYIMLCTLLGWNESIPRNLACGAMFQKDV